MNSIIQVQIGPNPDQGSEASCDNGSIMFVIIKLGSLI